MAGPGRARLPLWARAIGVLLGLWAIVASPAIAGMLFPAAAWLGVIAGTLIIVCAIFPTRRP